MQGEVRENDCNCQNGFKCSAWCENEVSTVAEDGAKRVLKVCSTQIQWQNWLNVLWLPIRNSNLALHGNSFYDILTSLLQFIGWILISPIGYPTLKYWRPFSGTCGFLIVSTV